MAQLVCKPDSSSAEILLLPEADELVMPGVCWGRADELFTPAFWASLAWLDSEHKIYEQCRLGSTVTEEIAACLLGGYGMSADLGLAAFHQLRILGLLTSCPPIPSEEELLAALSQPFSVQGRIMHYRFPRQRSYYLKAMLTKILSEEVPDKNSLCFRNWLLSFPGIGPKTASWITRNWLCSNDVAILDIHIFRAGVIAGFFRPTDSVSRDYFSLERKFLEFSRAIGVLPSILDTLIWSQMRGAGSIAHDAFNAVAD